MGLSESQRAKHYAEHVRNHPDEGESSYHGFMAEVLGLIADGQLKPSLVPLHAETLVHDAKAAKAMEDDSLGLMFRPEQEGRTAGKSKKKNGPDKRAVYKQKVDAWARGELPTNEVIELGPTPKAFQAVGGRDVPMVISQSILNKSRERHGIPIEILSELPSLLDDPVMIFKSNTGPTRRIALVERRLPDGKALMVVVSLEAKSRPGERPALESIEVSDIRSVHPKEHDARLLHWINDNRTVYWNPEKTRAFLQNSAPTNRGQFEEKLSQVLSSDQVKNQGKNPGPVKW
jgi:hypothetical protein